MISDPQISLSNIFFVGGGDENSVSSFTGLSKLLATNQVPYGLDTAPSPGKHTEQLLEMCFLVALWVGQIPLGHTTQETNPLHKAYISSYQALLGVPSNQILGTCSLHHTF